LASRRKLPARLAAQRLGSTKALPVAPKWNEAEISEMGKRPCNRQESAYLCACLLRVGLQRAGSDFGGYGNRVMNRAGHHAAVQADEQQYQHKAAKGS